MSRMGRRPKAGQVVERSSFPGGSRTSSHRNNEGRGKADDARALPAVPAPAAGGEPAMRWPRKGTQEPGGVAGGSGYEEPYGGHPMDDFDDLLQAFDGILGGTADGTSIAHHNLGSDQRGTPVPAVGSFQLERLRTAPDDGVDRLPRLDSRSSSASAADTFFRTHPRTGTKRRRTSHTPPPQESPLALCNSTGERHRVLYSLYHNDKLNIMLRSRGQRRPALAAELSNDNLDTGIRKADANFGDGGSGAVAGVFRLSHAGTGFVHYGYSWDITGAKADQLKRLSSGNSSDPHPHRGLSAVVRGQQQYGNGDQIEAWASRKTSFGSLKLLFEVVRRVPMPTRFRAGDFEKKLREACTQELLDRREYLLVLAARQYQRKHVHPAFTRMLAVCRREGDDEQYAAAAEIQRAWRGFQVRVLSQHAREIDRPERAETECTRAGHVLAIWAQAMHRGNNGRRRANETRERQTAEAMARENQASAAAAVTIQRRVRSVSQARKGAAAAADKTAVDELLRAVREEKEANESQYMGVTPSPPPRPISASEVRVSNDLCEVSSEASISAASDWGSTTLAAPRDSSRSIEQQPQRAPSNREFRRRSSTRSLDDNNQHPPSRKQRGRKRPASAPRFSDVAGAQSPGDSLRPATPTAVAPAVLPDASRLVLEGDPGFAAATAIQAAWRGFITRIGVRKRRRAAAALRRKREGKWRQQRGVVGKRLSVSWDMRRGLEEGGGWADEGGARRRGSECCVEIQRMWRGALGRMIAIRVRTRWLEETEASVRIQRTFRGMVGRQEARSAREARNKNVAAAFLVTRQALQFIRNLKARRQRRHHAATVIQCIVRGLASRRRVHRLRRSHTEYGAARKVQMMARGWFGRRQAWQRSVLTRLGACALCCSRLAEMYFEATEQELCLECYRTTSTAFENRKFSPAHFGGAFEMLEHRKRQRAATLTQRAWLRFQSWASTRFGVCEVCPRWAGPGTPLPRAARAVCTGGCDRRRHLRYCRRCCAIAHSLRVNAGHEIRSVDRYGTEMAAVATLGAVMWRYNVKLRFWKIFATHRSTLNSSATLVQAQWRSHRCSVVFAALRRGFLYVEAAARLVERYWAIRINREDVMAHIAGFMTSHDVLASPPGLHPAPSGPMALWESLVLDVVRTRAVERIQLEWRKKIERTVARALAQIARLQMIERQRIRTLAELHASICIQRIWRGSQGRDAAFRRAATIAFARETAERYIKPDRFAVANLRAFNAHGGFLGMAGVDARSILAAAVGFGGERQVATVKQNRRERFVGSGRNRNGEEACGGDDGGGGFWLRLKPHGEDDWGLSADARVAGIVEVRIRVCLQRCHAPHVAAGALPPPGTTEGEETAQAEMEDTNGYGDIRDVPPLTLKLELISIYSGSCLPRIKDSSEERSRIATAVAPHGVECDDDDSSRASSDYASGEGSSYGSASSRSSRSSSSEKGRHPRGRSISEKNSGSSDGSAQPKRRNSETTDESSGGRSVSDVSKQSGRNSTTATTSDDSDVNGGSHKARQRSSGLGLKNGSYLYDCGELDEEQHLCEVTWCGETVGGTRAPLAGLPTPRWEGQVFYLPLCAAANERTASAASKQVHKDLCGAGHQITGDGSWTEESLHRQGAGGQEEACESPAPLLVVALNKLSRRTGDRFPCNGVDQAGRRGCGSSADKTTWSAFVSGLIHPLPVGRAVLEAGDVLSMLGSQQVVDVIPLSRGGRTDDQPSREGAARGWQLRLLLSLEDRERTRTRLLVTEVLAAIISGIVDVIPGKVPRIEVRVVGTRALSTSASTHTGPSHRSCRKRDRRLGNSSCTSAQSCRKPSLRLSALWNGDHAASVNLSTCEGNSLTMSKSPAPAAGNRGGRGCFGGGGVGFGNGDAVHRGPRASETSRLVVLPLHVPWIMSSDEKGLCSCVSRANTRCCGIDNSHRGSGDGFGGCGGCGGAAGSGEAGSRFGREGGRSHCLQVRVDANPRASTSDRTNPNTFGNESRGSNEGRMTVSSSNPIAIPRRTGVCFFERDLLRSEWTEVLVPVCTDDLKKNVRSRKQHRRAKETPPDLAVVLQVRSAGFAPKDPPLWLLRRDFAERAVERIMAAAAAALVQPRVEMTLLGLCGAIDLLLSESASEEKGGIGDVVSETAGPLLPTKPEGKKSNDVCHEVLCEAFWNGTLIHKLRLHRAVPASPPAMDESKAVVSYSSRRGLTSAIGTARLGGSNEDEPPSSEKDKEKPVEGAVLDPAGARPAHPRGSDPSTWFSGGRDGHEDPLGSDWVTLSGGEFPSQKVAAAHGGAAGKQQPVVPKTDAKPLRKGDVRRKYSGRLSGTIDADEETNEGEKKSTRQPLAWVPAEGEVFGGRPFRFFLPACIADNAAGGQTRESHPRESGARGEENGGTGDEGETTDGSGSNGDAGNTGNTGDLRLVFWALPSSSSAAHEPNNPTAYSGETGMCTAMTVKQKAVGEGSHVRAAAAAARRRQRGGETGRRLLGWASLVDDELLLQPRGHRIELALSAKAGLDVSTAWSMAHDLKRKVHAYRATEVSVVAVVRHFDVPRGPILSLRCPAPFIEVEVIDGHNLPKAPGQLSVNPYVVLTLDGEAFARSSTSRGAAFPVWSSEVFLVRVSPPSPGEWPLTAQKYFKGYRGKPSILGARVYSQVGPQAAPSLIQKGVLHGGVGEGDVLLGEAQLPFSLLKELPFHYLPLRLQPPPLPPPTSPPRRTDPCDICSGTVFTPHQAAGRGIDGNHESDYTHGCRVCGGIVQHPPDKNAGDTRGDETDLGLLGIGVRMVFPNPTIPDAPRASSLDGGSVDSSALAPVAGSSVDAGKGATTAGAVVEGDKIVLSVHEAEALVNNARRGESLNPYCVALVGGLEVGRTTTITDSSEPLWATDFHLPDELLLGPGPPSRNMRKVVGVGRGMESTSSQLSPVLVALEVWDSVPEGDPVLLGAVEVPPDALQKVLPSSSQRDQDKRREREGPRGSLDLHLLSLNLRPLQKGKQPQNPQLAGIVSGESKTTAIAAAKTAGDAAAEAKYSGKVGVLSFSLKRVVSDAAQSGIEEAHNRPQAAAEDGPRQSLLAEESGNVAGLGKEAMETGTTETALERHRAAKVKCLAESARKARKRLNEARTMMENPGSMSRGRSANDCPKVNAARFARAWQREASRAEQAELLATRRPTVELRQEMLDLAQKPSRGGHVRPRSAGPATRGGGQSAKTNAAITAVPSAGAKHGEQQRASRMGNDDIGVPRSSARDRGEAATKERMAKNVTSSAAGADHGACPQEKAPPMVDRLKTPLFHGIEGDAYKPVEQEAGGKQGMRHSARGGHSSRNVDHGEDGDEEEGGGQQDEEEEKGEPSALEKILPQFPAPLKEVFVKLEAVLGLLPPFTARGSAVSARVFWGGQEVGRTRSITVSRTTPAASASAASVPFPEGATPSGRKDGNKRNDEDSAVLVLRESLVDKARDAAAIAATSLVQATSAAAHGSALGGGGGSMEGQWDEETFLLPLPDGDDTLLAGHAGGDAESDDGGNLDTEKDSGGVSRLSGIAEQGSGDADSDAAGRESSSVSVDDGVHLRVEIWQGKHCHGQVELEGSELLRMCKKVQNATPGDRADFVVDCRGGGVRLPDHFPHFLPNPEAFSPYKLALVPREGDDHRRESSAAAPARLTMTLLALDPGQAVAAQGQLAVALEDTGSRLLRQHEDGRPKYREGGNTVGSTRTKATGIAEALVNVLNARRSPLSFRVQPLVLHLNTLDAGDNGWKGGQEPGMFLVAKREVLAVVDESPSVSVSKRKGTETDGKTGECLKPPVAWAKADSKGGRRSSSHNAGAMHVVEEEELGRIGPFSIHSPTTVLSGSSFTFPSNALVADVQRRGGSGAGRNSARSGEESVEYTVLEIIENTAGVGSSKRPFSKKLKKHARDSTSEGTPGGGGTVIARATLDPGFLRRTIGCQRSVVMMTTPTGVGGASAFDQNAENAGRSAPLSFARLDVAGHAVSARPGRPQLRVHVLECQNLRSADVVGKSDPCVLVSWDGVEVGRTPIACEELHPVFPASEAAFYLPLVPPSTTSTERGDRRSGPKSRADWQAYTPELRLEVWDMDRDVFSRKWKKGQMLGSVTLRGPCGIAPVIEASTGQGAKGSTTAPVKRLAPGAILRLNSSDRRVSGLGSAAGKPEQASTGVVSIRIAVENDTEDSEAWVSQANDKATTARRSKSSGAIVSALESNQSGGRSPEADIQAKAGRQAGLGIWCLDARGLPVGCDGYCRVFWNGMQVGRTPPASHVSQDLRNRISASKNNAAPASAFQRNPVWWKSLVQAEPCDGNGEERSGPKSSSATAVVPLYDNPSLKNELTFEVFDGRHIQETDQNITSSGDLVAGSDASDGRRRSGAVGNRSENSNTGRRDVLGRSLGSVTVRGEHLVRPPGDRIDLPLQLSSPSSGKYSNAAGVTLSITLAPVRLGELSAGSMAPSTHPQQGITSEQEQHQYINIVSTDLPMVTAEGDGGHTGASDQEQSRQRPTRWLRLLIEGARLFKGLDISGTSDPFCVVYVDRVWHSETRVCWGTLAPRWDQWLQIEVFGRTGAPALGLGLADHEVRVEVWDKDLVGANDFIGESHLLLHENQDGTIQVRTRNRPDTSEHPAQELTDDRKNAAKNGRASENGGLQHHSLELCREGEKKAPPPAGGKRGNEPIGTLSCSTLLYTEKSWRTKVASMNLPWVLGAASEGDCVVIQLAGAVLHSGKQALGAGCFALLRWDGRVVGRTPISHDLHEPSWHEQTFALQMDTNPSCDVLDVDIYFAGANDARASGDCNAPSKASTSSFFAARCRLEGPFRNERFPDFTSDYPLLLLGEEERAPREDSEANQGVVRKGPESSHSRPKKKSSVRVAGSVRLRIGVAASSTPAGSRVVRDGSDSKVADSAAVGDEDSPEVRRRRTNTVDRRLRLGVGWVSLVRLCGLAPNAAIGPTNKDTEGGQLSAAHDGGDAKQPGDVGAKKQRQSRQRSRTDHRASSSTPADSENVGPEQPELGSCSGALRASKQAAGRLRSLLPVPGSGISCRVIWCGVYVTSFELCPKTGLLLTPGECLLELPRGTPWRSCQLVLEVIATDQCVRHPGMQDDALEHWQRLHSQHILGGDTSTPQAENGPHLVLGRVAVGWQVLKTLKEQAYQFTTCHEDAVPDASGCGLGEDGYVDLQCCLCVPIATRERSTDGAHECPPTAVEGGSRSDAVDDDRGRTASSPADAPAIGNVGVCRAWKVLPARIAFSLRLERLAPSRPPRPSRAPPIAPANSVCRLRLGVRGGGPIIRASHPRTLLSRNALPESSTVMVGWNGYDASVGPSKEWPVDIPSAGESLTQPSGVSTDLLLTVPRNGRTGLVLTLRVVGADEGRTDAGADAVATLGSVSIDWDGLSCLPASGTDYFVGTPSRNSLVRPASVDLELLANAPPSSSSATVASAPCTSVCGVNSAPASKQMPTTGGRSIKPCNKENHRTAGIYVGLNLQLEASLASISHALSLSPVAARGPTAVSSDSRAAPKKGANGGLSAGMFSAGDFRDPCRKQRVPYLRFSWPWDDCWSASVQRRNSTIAQRPWHHGSRRAVTWTRKGRAANGSIDEGKVSVRLPQRLSGLDGGVARSCSQEPRGVNTDEKCLSVGADFTLNARAQQCHPPPPVLFVEAYDMGPYAPLEHRAAMAVQRVWRRALSALRSAREWWEYYAMVDRHNAAVCVQAHYRGWKGRQKARVAKRDATVRGAATTVVQRQWRCWRARCKAEELRTEGLRQLRELEKLEQERAARRLELRRAELSVLVSRGAGLLGMDLSGLSDPFCVVFWNDLEVGRTAVRCGTRDPDWAGDDSGGQIHAWFQLPFFVPEADKWGEQAWPPMCIEIRCYDHDVLSGPDLIGRVKLGTDAILAMVNTVTTGHDSVDGIGGQAAGVSTTWLELEPGGGDNENTPAIKARNPFESLGNIAVALTAKRALPSSLEGYRRAKQEERSVNWSTSIADAAVLALMQAVRRSLCSRDRCLWVVDASGLVKADFFGKSDPYAKVFWDGREIGTTGVCRKTLNPVWFSGPAGSKQPKTAASSPAAQEDKPYFWLESTCSVNPRLRVELYDWDAVSIHDFLGEVELDMAELVELQRATLGKARGNGGNTDEQLLLKTDYPLRSRDNKIGKNGTVGLCVYLDLEQTKRRQRREQAAAARRQQAIDLALAEVDMKNEALERTLMGSEDVDALDMEQMQRQRERDEASSWQVYYDESTNPPTPWWFNSRTGVSTWECPLVVDNNKGTPSEDLTSTNAAGEDRRQSQPQRQLVVAGGETDEANAWQMFYDDESVDAPVPWWFNSVTGESTWECPTALTTAVSQAGDTGPEGESKTGHVGHEVAVVKSGVDQGWTQLWSEEYQASYYVDETTQETSWDAPILAPEMATELVEPAETAAQGDGQGETVAASASWAGGDGGNEHHDAVGSSSGQEQALVVPAAGEQPQFSFYVNERGNRVFLVPRKAGS